MWISTLSAVFRGHKRHGLYLELAKTNIAAEIEKLISDLTVS